MSSRALRRMQRELEEEKLRNQGASPEDGEEEESEDEAPVRPAKKSAFELLNAADNADDDDSDDEGVAETAKTSQPDATADADSDEDVETQKPTLSTKAKKKKKKKSKAKSKGAKESVAEPKQDPEMDEIDMALKSLGSADRAKGDSTDPVISRELNQFYYLLSVDRQHLNALNEMKKLFGSVVLERDDNEEAAARRQRNNQGVAISDFISARYSRVSRGQGLSGLALRQNVFMVGKPEWPKTASGGLSMELVERADDFTTEYRFVHSSMYQQVQADFTQATRSMDPQAMFQMVYNNPYHIASLLQTAEVLKHQGDHSVAADLYERALYNFGRSVQSTFAAALSEGKARMDFRRPENREFWLTGFHYIGALIQRGTFRTAYEWAKLLLSLDPEGDPYCVRLILDQLAIKGGQFQHLIDLASTRVSLIDWGQGSPNVRISLALAHYRLKQSEEAQDTLAIAVKDFPWIFARLFQQLDVEKTPKSIWGSQPRTDLEKFEMESYAARGKDIWNTPEALAFLQEVVEASAKPTPEKSEDRPVTLDEARHALVSGVASIIGAVPREYTTRDNRSTDPLPPPDDQPSYDPSGVVADVGLEEFTRQDVERLIDQARLVDPGGENNVRMGRIAGLLNRALNMFGAREPVQQQEGEAGDAGAGPGAEGGEENYGRLLGMEEVTVRTMEEYLQALELTQWPIPAANAAPEVPHDLQNRMRSIPRATATEAAAVYEEVRLHQLMQNAAEDASAQQRSSEQQRERRDEHEAAIRDAQSRQQATVEDYDSDEDEAEAGTRQDQQRLMGSMTRDEMSETLKKDYDNDSNKRWLAGRGMLALKDFVAEHGPDEGKWLNDPRVDKAPVTEYLARTSLLNSGTDKNFILEYALKQGAGQPASDMIIRLL